MFRAYFTEGRNLDDILTLQEIGNEAGLNTDALSEELKKEVYADDVNTDIYEAWQIGVRSVPFFVFNNKYAVIGAQEPELFSETLEKAFDEWRKVNINIPYSRPNGPFPNR